MPVLEIETKDHVALVTLNRPEARNALDPELIVALARAWDGIRADAEIRAVVLTSAAGSTFCAGFDLARTIPLLTAASEPTNDWERALADDRTLAEQATLRDGDLGRPLIIAANGHAIAGGMEMLLAGDIRVAAAGAKLGLSEVRLGLIPAMGGTAKLARHMPAALAAELLLTGAPITAERAAAAGFVNHVVPADEVQGVAMKLARTIAGNAPLAVAAARDVLRKSPDLSAADALALEAAATDRLTATEDAVEGPRAFLEKRPPVFKGR